MQNISVKPPHLVSVYAGYCVGCYHTSEEDVQPHLAELGGQFANCKVLKSANIGFHIKMFLLDDGSGNSTLVVRGTDNGENVGFDVLLGLGHMTLGTLFDKFSGPLHTATQLLEAWETEFHRKVTALAGHSLGGYVIANMCRNRTDVARFAFNAPYVPNIPNLLHICLQKDVVSSFQDSAASSKVTMVLQNSSFKKAHQMERVYKKVQEAEQDGRIKL